MLKTTIKLILFSFFSTPALLICAASSQDLTTPPALIKTHATRSSASPRRRDISSSKNSRKYSKAFRNYKSADFSAVLHKKPLSHSMPSSSAGDLLIKKRADEQSAPSSANDQDLKAVIKINADISKKLKNLQGELSPTIICSSSTDSPPVPRLTLPRELLEQAYRALALLELVKKRYPQDPNVHTQIKQTLEYIYTLDPPKESDDGIPESARGSSGRLRCLIEMNSAARKSPASSPLAKQSINSAVEEHSIAAQSVKEESPRHPKKKKHKKKHRKKSKRGSRHAQPSTLENMPEETKLISSSSSSPKSPLLRLQLEDLHTHETLNPDTLFIDSFYELVDSLNHKLELLLPPELSPRISPRKLSQQIPTLSSGDKEKIRHILTSLLPLFTPLVEHYYSGLSENEAPSIERAICSAYRTYARIQTATGFDIILSEQTAKDIDTCANIVQDIQTPRSLKKEELKVDMLRVNLIETMILISKNGKTVVEGPATHNIHDPMIWNTGTITAQTLFLTVKELFAKLKRGNDLWRLIYMLPHYEPLTTDPEIKILIQEATVKLRRQGEQARMQISPRHK